jgi:hypothetical protein
LDFLLGGKVAHRDDERLTYARANHWASGDRATPGTDVRSVAS